jgi:hypothetical protein
VIDLSADSPDRIIEIQQFDFTMLAAVYCVWGVGCGDRESEGEN